MKNDRVVCISEKGFHSWPYPKVGNIEVVLKSKKYRGRLFYRLEGYNDLDTNGHIFGFCAENFRPVDSNFGPAVCETIEQQIEYEKALEPVYQ